MSSLIPVVPLTGELSSPAKLSGSITGVKEIIGGHISDDLLAANKYTGSYNAVPRKVQQVLNTSDKLMVNDLTIEAISYSEVLNSEGGTTVVIGYE